MGKVYKMKPKYTTKNKENKPKENIFNLKKFENSKIIIKMVGGRQIEGTVKSYDSVMNVVLLKAIEHLKDPLTSEITNKRRTLGTVFCKGISIASIVPFHFVEIENPFE